MSKKGTYVWMQETTKKRLDSMKDYPRQSYNTIIENVLESFEKCKSANKKAVIEKNNCPITKEIKQDLESFISSIGDRIFILDKNDRFIGICGGREKYTFLKPEEIIGKKHEEVLPPKANRIYKRAAKKVRETGKTQSYEYPMPLKNKRIWFEVKLDLHKDGESIIATTRDITNKKGNRERLERILNQSNEFYYFHGTDYVITYVSPQSKKMFGYEPKEMKEKWLEFTTDNPINKKCHELTKKAIQTGEKQKPYILEVERKDGSTFLAEINESPVKDEDGNVICIAGVMRDVSKIKKKEKELRESKKRFKEIEELMTDISFEKRKD